MKEVWTSNGRSDLDCNRQMGGLVLLHKAQVRATFVIAVLTLFLENFRLRIHSRETCDRIFEL